MEQLFKLRTTILSVVIDLSRITFGRHSFKPKGKELSFNGISAKGVSEALKSGRKMVRTTRNPNGTMRTVKYYAGQGVDLGKLSTDSLRTVATAEMHRQGFMEKGGKVITTKNRRGEVLPTEIRLRKDLGFGLAFKDKATYEKILNSKYGGDQKKGYTAWVNGKELFNGAMIPPHEAVKRLTRFIALGIRAERMGRKDFEISNHSHAWYADALVEELTGKSINSFNPTGLLRENEKAIIDVKDGATTNPKVFIKYRNKKPINITSALKEKFPNVLKGKF